MESPDYDDHGSGRTGEKPGWTGTPTPHDSDNSGVESENTSYNKNNIYKNTKGREDEGAYGTPAPVYLSICHPLRILFPPLTILDTNRRKIHPSFPNPIQ